MYNTYKVDLVTGVVQGETMRSKNEIIPHTNENESQMRTKYCHNKQF